MNGETKNRMQCAEFDALLADALDGTLSDEKQAGFERHKTECATCSAMFAEAEAGLKWLETLEEVEPPRNLVHNILVATSGVAETAREAQIVKPSLWDRVRPWFTPHISPLMTRRFAMSCAMAFFSVSMVMSVTGIRPKDLTPKGFTRAYVDGQTKLVKYYESIRFVYEVESRAQDLRRVMGGNDRNSSPKQRQKEAPKDEKQNNTNREPEQKQYQNYSRDKDDGVLVALDIRLPDPSRQRREI